MPAAYEFCRIDRLALANVPVGDGQVTRSASIPARMNAMLAAALIALHAALLLALPALGASTPWMIALAAAAVALSPTLWALIHEAIHGLLFARPSANARAGRALAIVFGTPFRAVRFAHLRHHRYNRTAWGREEVYDPAVDSRLRACVAHYARITIGLYAGELALLLVCWLPVPLLRRALRAMHREPPDARDGIGMQIERSLLCARDIREIRIDAALTLALYGASFALCGERGWIVAALLALRGTIASQLDHAPHHGTPLDRRDYALNLSAPRWLRLLLLNFPLHRTHHRHPNLPWSALPGARESAATELSLMAAVLRQWRGPIAIGELSRSASAAP